MSVPNYPPSFSQHGGYGVILIQFNLSNSVISGRIFLSFVSSHRLFPGEFMAAAMYNVIDDILAQNFKKMSILSWRPEKKQVQSQ